MILVDKKSYFEFLPMLPDVIGGWMAPELLRYDLASFAKNEHVEFINGRIKGIDPGNKVIEAGGREIEYEYAVLAAGSETNFYGNTVLQNSCLKLDDVNDAVSIKETILRKAAAAPEINILVVGGGYTGVEIATNIDILLRTRKNKYRVYIVEKGDEILMMAPEWMRASVRRVLGKAGIDLICGDALKEYDGENVILDSGKKIGNAVCVWTAGVKVPGFLERIPMSSQRTRIIVDEYLRPKGTSYRDIFIAGDNSFFEEKASGKALRMAVMFSMGQGKTAADNIVNSIRGKAPVKYRPVDLGYLVPMAQGKAPGVVMGAGVDGLCGYFMHYLMCAYRSEWRNKAGILKELVLSRLKTKKEG